MGLGDEGVHGLKEFQKQHRCNSICIKLALPREALQIEAPENGT